MHFCNGAGVGDRDHLSTTASQGMKSSPPPLFLSRINNILQRSMRRAISTIMDHSDHSVSKRWVQTPWTMAAAGANVCLSASIRR
jgi:hypothetical protein